MCAYKIICITGPDGSGKSTLIDILKTNLPRASVTSIWDLIKESSTQNIVPFKTAPDVDVYLARLHAKSRFLFLMHCLAEAFEIAKEKEPAYIIMDSYWYKYYATELSYGISPAYMDKVVFGFEKPDYLFYLNADENLTSGRKKKFSQYECGFASELNEQTFKSFQKKTIFHLQQLMNTIDPIVLDAGISSQENCKIILHSLNC